MKKLLDEKQVLIDDQSKSLDKAHVAMAKAREVMEIVVAQNLQLKEWHVATQRQLKKRYDQIHELNIDLKNANDKLQWYSQNQESHAKTNNIVNLSCKVDIDATEAKAVVDTMVQTLKRAQHQGAAKPYKVKVFINSEFYGKTHEMITSLIEKIGKTGCEVHLHVEDQGQTQLISMRNDSFIFDEQIAKIMAGMDNTRVLDDDTVFEAAIKKIVRLEQILECVGLVREPSG